MLKYNDFFYKVESWLRNHKLFANKKISVHSFYKTVEYSFLFLRSKLGFGL